MENPQVPPAAVVEVQAIPESIKQWNWGGFFLGLIWGISNRVWISLLVLVPFLNVLVPFYLGAKGNELAWKSKQWKSEEEFHTVQKKWAIAGIVITVVVSVLYLIVMLTYTINLNNQIQNELL